MNTENRDDEFLRKRKARQRKIRRRRIKIFLVLLLLLAVGAGVILSLTVFFKIESISASGSSKYSAEEIIAASGIKKGDNLFVSSVNDEKLKRKLPYIEKITVKRSLPALYGYFFDIRQLAFKLPYIEKITVKRSLPATFTIKVTDAEEYVCYLSGDKYYPVSRSGRVLSKTDEKSEGIPEISAGGLTLKVGRKLAFAKEKTENTLNEIFENAEKTEIRVTRVDITDELAITLGVDGRFTVNLGTSNYIDKKFAHLSGMMKNMDASAAGKINLSMWTPSNAEGSFVSSASGG